MRLEIEKITYKGYGLGFHNSKAVFVPHTCPGDIVEISNIIEKKKFCFGKLKKIIKSSEFRQLPNCEVFGKCGGCDLLHINYQTQLHYKQKIVKEIFRNDKIEELLNIQDSKDEFYYRNKIFMPIQNDIYNNPIIGYYAKKTHRIIPYKKCCLQPVVFDKIAREFTLYLKASKAKIYNETNHSGNIRHLGIRSTKKNHEILVIVETKNSKLPFSKQLTRILTEKFPNIIGIVQNVNKEKGNRILGNKKKILFGRDYVYDELNDFRFRVHYDSFFQVNSFVAEKMLDFLIENTNSQENVLDSYCGVGIMGISLAKKAKRVIGIENNSTAVQDAIFNAKLNKLDNIEFIEQDTNKIDSNFISQKKISTVIFDPPRKGLNKNDLQYTKYIPKIIYISCNPVTQRRDLQLLQSFGYKIVKMKSFDMFPHTYHIENIAILEK